MKSLPAPVIALLLVLPASAAGQGAEPRITVSLEREAMVARDSTRAHLWIVNPSATALDSVALEVHAPGFVTFRVDEGGWTAAGARVRLGALPARAAAAHTVLLRTGAEVEEGDATLAFAVHYRMRARGDTGAVSSVAVAEKKLKVGLLGTENVGGVSLRLAALLVPGLLFLVLLRLLKVGWAAGLGAAESATFSVVGSVLLFGAVAALWPPVSRSGISIVRFLALCGAAAVLAGVAAWGDRKAARHRARFLVAETDDAELALEKLLRRRAGSALDRLFGKKPETEAAVEVRTAAKRYVGALMGTTTDGGVALLGWFRIDVDPGNAKLWTELDGLGKGGEWVQVLKVARRNGLKLNVHHEIRDGNAAAGGMQRIAAKDVVSRAEDPAGAPGLPPITLARQ